MRYRERVVTGNLINTKAVGYRSDGSCASPEIWNLYPAYDLVGSYRDHSSTETFLDVVTPNFEKRRDHGEVINNPMVKTLSQSTKTSISMDNEIAYWKYLTCSGTAIKVLRTDGSRQIGTLSPDSIFLAGTYPPTPSVDETVVREIAVTAAWANVSSADINAYATMAESGETIQSFKSIAGRIIKTVNQLRKGNLKAVWKQFTPKQLADRWMEGRYAVRPLVYDIHGVVAALQPLVRRSERHVFRGGNSATETSSVVTTTYYPTSWYRVWGNFSTSRTITARSGVLTAILETSQVSKWGLDQPLEALWELVPYSFICDWFFNVGKVLASWTPNTGLKSLASWVTVDNTVLNMKSINRVDDVYVWTPSTWSRHIAIAGGACTTTATVRSRVINPCRSLVPHLTVRLDAAKLLDLVIIGKKLLSS